MATPDPLALASRDTGRGAVARQTQIPAGKVQLEAHLVLPSNPRGLVLFAHGSGSSHTSPRDQQLAQALRRQGFGTLLFDALTPAERRQDAIDERLRFDIALLARRLAQITDWARSQSFGALPVGYFGASSAAAAAIVAAAERPNVVKAVVCRSGRPDLARSALRKLRAPTLLIVGSEDPTTLALSELALSEVPSFARLEIVPGAGNLFEEPGVFDMASELSGDWLVERLVPDGHSASA